jgi:uncharacterized membrane protein
MFYTHPAFVVVYILFGLGLIIGSVFLSNAFQSYIESEGINETATYLPKMTFIMGNLPLIVLIVVVISIVVIYKSQRAEAV